MERKLLVAFIHMWLERRMEKLKRKLVPKLKLSIGGELLEGASFTMLDCFEEAFQQWLEEHRRRLVTSKNAKKK